MPTTWSTTDKTATNLTNGDLTATGTGAGGVRSVYSASAGKFYWEVQFVAGAAPGLGIANAAAVLATVWNTPTNAAAAFNASIYVNNVSQPGAAGIVISNGTTICVALDIDAQRIWFRSGAAGNWNNSGTANPATNTGGLNIAVLGVPLFALVCTLTSAQHTVNFGATAFVGTPPSGFTAGFGPAAASTQARVMVLA
jgi:hypothetical protein